MTPEQIVNRTAQAHGVTAYELIGRGRRQRLVAARREAAVALREAGLPLAEIGRLLGGRDHSSIHYLLGQNFPRQRRQPQPKVCTVDRCGRPTRARGWCAGHYDRWRRLGDVHADVPLGAKTRSDRQGCGTPAAYNRGCRCGDCRAAHAAAAAARYEPLRVGTVRVRRHVDRLVEAGMSGIQIAQQAGVAQATVSKLRRGETTRMHPEIAGRLLAVLKPCEDCGRQAYLGGRWCAVGGCEQKRGRWSWSQRSAA